MSPVSSVPAASPSPQSTPAPTSGTGKGGRSEFDELLAGERETARAERNDAGSRSRRADRFDRPDRTDRTDRAGATRTDRRGEARPEKADGTVDSDRPGDDAGATDPAVAAASAQAALSVQLAGQPPVTGQATGSEADGAPDAADSATTPGAQTGPTGSTTGAQGPGTPLPGSAAAQTVNGPTAAADAQADGPAGTPGATPLVGTDANTQAPADLAEGPLSPAQLAQAQQALQAQEGAATGRPVEGEQRTRRVAVVPGAPKPVLSAGDRVAVDRATTPTAGETPDADPAGVVQPTLAADLAVQSAAQQSLQSAQAPSGATPAPAAGQSVPGVQAAATSNTQAATQDPGDDAGTGIDPAAGQAFSALLNQQSTALTRTEAPSSTPNQSATPAPPVTDQVAAQLGKHLSGTRRLADGSHTTVIKLSPEQLGDVTVKLDVRENGVRMELIAAPQALSALQNDLNQLRDQLAQSGLDLGDVTFSQPDLSQGGPQQDGTPQQAGERGSDGPRGRETGPRERRTEPAAPPAQPVQGGRFDVRV